MPTVTFHELENKSDKEILLMLFNQKSPIKRIADKMGTTKPKVQDLCATYFKQSPSFLRSAIWEYSKERIVNIGFIRVTLDEIEINDPMTRVIGGIAVIDPNITSGTLVPINEVRLDRTTFYNADGQAIKNLEALPYTLSAFVASTESNKSGTNRFNVLVRVENRHQNDEDLDLNKEDLSFQLTFSIPILVYSSYSETGVDVGQDTSVWVKNAIDLDTMDGILGGDPEPTETPNNDMRVSISAESHAHTPGKCIDVPITVNGLHVMVAHLHHQYAIDHVNTAKELLNSSLGEWFKSEVRKILKTYVDGALSVVYIMGITVPGPQVQSSYPSPTASRPYGFSAESRPEWPEQ